MSPSSSKSRGIMQSYATILFTLVTGACSMPLMDPSPLWSTGLFEGDINLLPKQASKSGKTDEESRWPNATMYYTIEPTFADYEKEFILEAIDEYHKRTCIRMVERTDQKNYVVFKNSELGCFSSVGMMGGAQEVNLFPSCFYAGSGVPIHEMLHTLGFWHQQSAPNRDDWVLIVLDNVKLVHKHNFKKYSDADATDFGVGYDYDSIMHYGPYAFSMNGEKTIIPIKDPDAKIGQCEKLSEKDILKLHRMYNCE